MCKRWGKRIEYIKGFNLTWIRHGSLSIKKDRLKSHTATKQHQEAVCIEERSVMGVEVYSQKVVENSPIGRSVRKMQDKDRESLHVKFNDAYYLAKQERPYSAYTQLLILNKKNNIQNLGKAYANDRAVATFNFANARHYSVLSDGSTDSAVIEQELVYVLYLSPSRGSPKMKFLSIESAENGDANGLKEFIKTGFERFGITEFSKLLLLLSLFALVKIFT